MAHITRVVAHIVAFNMCTNSAYTAYREGSALRVCSYRSWPTAAEVRLSDRSLSRCTAASDQGTHLVHHLFGLSVADAEASGLVVSAV